MDIRKAKTVLIIALLVTDLFLAALLWLPSKSADVEMADTQTVMGLLESRGVYADTELPRARGELAALNVEGFYVSPFIVNMATEAIELDSSTATAATYKNTVDKLLEELGFPKEGLSLTSAEVAERVAFVTYKNVVNEVEVEGCYIRCAFVDGRVADFAYNWLVPKSLSEYKRPTISAEAALLRFAAENPADGEIHISSMDMVYYLDISDFPYAVEDTAFPTWRIMYNGGLTGYVSAFE